MTSRSGPADIGWVGPYYPQLMAVALVRQRRLRWIMEVDELVHQALLRWAPKQSAPQAGEPLTSQQLGTFSLSCRNVLVDELRNITRRRKLRETLARLPSRQEASAESRIGRLELAEHALSCLDERSRRVVELRYGRQLSFAEIGAELGCREASARQLHSRAIRRMREFIKPEPLV